MASVYKSLSRHLEEALKPVELYLNEQQKLFVELAKLNTLSQGIIRVFNHWIEKTLPEQVRVRHVMIGEARVNFFDVKCYPPFEALPNGTESYRDLATRSEPITPKRCRDRSETYSFSIYSRLSITDGEGIHETAERIRIGGMPVMLGSNLCHAYWNFRENRERSMDERIALGECPNDPLGYFITKGTEKVIIIQERLRTSVNITYPPDSKEDVKTQITCITPIGTSVVLMSNNKKFHELEVKLDRMPKDQRVNTFLLFGVLGFGPDDAIALINQFVANSTPEKAREVEVQLFINKLVYNLNKDQYVANIVNNDKMKYFLDDVQLRNTRATPAEQKKLVDERLITNLFMNIPPKHTHLKAKQLAIMCAQHISTMLEWRLPDKRDDWGNRRLESAGDMMKQLFNEIWEESLKFDTAGTENLRDISGIAARIGQVVPDKVNSQSDESFLPNSWGVKRSGKTSYIKENVTDPLKRETATSVYSQVGRISTPICRMTKRSSIRMLQRSQLGLICIGETPEGETCLAAGTQVLLQSGNLCAIEKLNIGDFVHTSAGTAAMVVRTTTFAAREVIQISTSNYSIVATPDHKVLTPQGFEVAAKASEVYTCDGWQAVSIRPAGQAVVYDITLGGENHGFYAGGIVVHNCGLVKNLAVTSKISFQSHVDTLKAYLGGRGQVFDFDVSPRRQGVVSRENVPIALGTLIHDGRHIVKAVDLDQHGDVVRIRVGKSIVMPPSGVLRAKWAEIRVNDIVVGWDVPEFRGIGPVSGIKTQTHNYTFLINGIYHGWVEPSFAELLRDGRRSGELDREVCICRNDIDQTIEFFSDGERPMRPLMRCRGSLPDIRGKDVDQLYAEGIIEYIDAREQTSLVIAQSTAHWEKRRLLLESLGDLKHELEGLRIKRAAVDVDFMLAESSKPQSVGPTIWADMSKRPLTDEDLFRIDVLRGNRVGMTDQQVIDEQILQAQAVTLSSLVERIIGQPEDPKNLEIYQQFVDQKIAELEARIASIMGLQLYEYCEIDPIAMFGIAGCLAPKAECQQGPRTTYQISMCKQALGGYHYNHHLRYETFKILPNATRPIFETSVSELSGLNTMPTGVTPIIAFYALEDNNEDAITIKQEFVESGALDIVKYTTHKTVVKIGLNASEKLEKPAPRAQEQVTDSAAASRYLKKYRAITATGLPEINTLLEQGDCIIAKVRGSDKPENMSQFVGVGEGNSYVDRIFLTRDGNQNIVVKIKTRQSRQTIPGDKMASRYAQKGTASNLIPSSQLIRVIGGPNHGLVPDFIVNPHCIPSRMTMGKPKEILVSKAALYSNRRVDGSTFQKLNVDDYIAQLAAAYYNHRYGTDIDVATISAATALDAFEGVMNTRAESFGALIDDLRKTGLLADGNETMCHPDGTLIDTKVFVGPCFYQALRHHVLDKIQMRGHRGAIKMDVHQPVRGRSLEGGIRFGEMERDSLISHGATSTLLERLFLVADPYSTVFCRNCGNLAISRSSEGKQVFICRICKAKGKEMYGDLPIPYVMKYISHMMIGLCMFMYIGTVSDATNKDSMYLL